MTTPEEFRLHAHELIIDLDTATTEMMKLIAAHQMNGPDWDKAIQHQHDAYERWVAYLNERS
jgi:hypothetical protein